MLYSAKQRPRGSKHATLGKDFRRLSLGVSAYHDETKPERDRLPFLAHGILFVPDESKNRLADLMLAARKRHGYFDEVHARDIRGATAQNKRFLVARDWVSDYFTWSVRNCPFKMFVIDYSQRAFPYPGDDGYLEHLQHSLRTALKAGIAWSFYREGQLRLRFVNDDTDNELERKVAINVVADLQSEINTRRLRTSKRYPWLRVSGAEFASSDPKMAPVERGLDAEFIQLCDLLLGASFWALDDAAATAGRAGRRRLARSVTTALGETLKVPWLQQVPVHRTFSVSLYPDKFNFAYPAALRLENRRLMERCQPTLF